MKPFECDLSQKIFTRKHNLKKHEKIYINENNLRGRVTYHKCTLEYFS